MNYEFHKCERCRQIARLYPDLCPDEVFNETFIRYFERYKNTPVQNPVGLFFLISKASAEYLRKHDKPDKAELVVEDWDNEMSPYQKALDNYIRKNNDPYSNMVEMYLLCPNLSKLARDTGIKKYHIKQILENAKNRIGFEYLQLLSHD